jgi:prophage antirepressor-like protein
MASINFPVTSQPMRLEVVEGEPWFHANDVCKILGLTNSREVVGSLEDPIKRKFDLEYVSGSDPWFIDEEALYTVALGCRDARKPGTVAYQFRKWVISVIKSIRKTGSYVATAADQQHFQPFGLVIQQKIEECDRYLETAPANGDIAKVLRNRKALEAAYKGQAKGEQTKQRSEAWEALIEKYMSSGQKATMDELFLYALKKHPGEWKRSDKDEVVSVMSRLGYEYRQQRDSDGVRRRYFKQRLPFDELVPAEE